MLEDIEYFTIIDKEDFTINLSNNQLHFKDKYLKNDIIENENVYYCVVPKNYINLKKWIYYKRDEYYLNEVDDEYDDNSFHNTPLISLENSIKEFCFYQIERKNNDIFIKKRYSPKEVFNFWMQKNTFSINTDFFKLSKVGITKKIINLIKNNHNYYDKNYICTCGQNGCDNLCVWIIKQKNTFCIPFIDDLSRRLHFNIDKLIDLYNYTPEDFNNDDSYNTYPFCFENSDFELYEKTHFANLKEGK